MNQKEINELRRRFRPEKSAISRVYGCYVNSSKEIVSDLDESLGMMPQEESEKYLSLLKKGLSGSLGKNLIDIVFSTQQVVDSEEHRLLTTLRDSQLKDNEARQTFYRKVIDSLDMGDSSYLLLLVCDSYDVSGQVLQGAVPLQRIYHSLDRLLEFWGIELVLIVRPPAMPEFLPAVAEVDSHMAYRAQRRILGLVQLGIEKTRLLNGSGPQYRKHLRNDSFFR